MKSTTRNGDTWYGIIDCNKDGVERTPTAKDREA